MIQLDLEKFLRIVLSFLGFFGFLSIITSLWQTRRKAATAATNTSQHFILQILNNKLRLENFTENLNKSTYSNQSHHLHHISFLSERPNICVQHSKNIVYNGSIKESGDDIFDNEGANSMSFRFMALEVS